MENILYAFIHSFIFTPFRTLSCSLSLKQLLATADCLLLYLCTHHRLFISLCTTAQTVYNCTYADHTTDCLDLYAPQQILRIIPQTAYTSVHHTTDLLYLCTPFHKLSIPLCTTTTDCLYLCTPYHRLSIPLYIIRQTVYTSVHHTTDCLYLCTQTVY